MSEADRYEQFTKELETKYPEMYHNVYCGISIDEGWFQIIRSLSDQLYHHVKHNNDRRAKLLIDNRYNQEIPEELMYPEVHQIKEKFGGLRFYADYTDDFAYGAICLAEEWAINTCEMCGKPGKIREGGWMKVLCDEHEAERQERMKERL